MKASELSDMGLLLQLAGVEEEMSQCVIRKKELMEQINNQEDK